VFTLSSARIFISECTLLVLAIKTVSLLLRFMSSRQRDVSAVRYSISKMCVDTYRVHNGLSGIFLRSSNWRSV